MAVPVVAPVKALGAQRAGVRGGVERAVRGQLRARPVRLAAQRARVRGGRLVRLHVGAEHGLALLVKAYES